MTVEEAAEILKEMYWNWKDRGRSVTTAIHLFGIRYADDLAYLPAKEIVLHAGIGHAHLTEVYKGIRLAEYVDVKSVIMQEPLTYKERSWAVLDQAYEELRSGDLAQASEKGWEAASKIVKAWASACDMDHPMSDRDLLRLAYHIARETGDDELGDLFNSAQALHINFHEEVMEPRDVTRYLDNIKKFVQKVEQLL